MCDTWKPCSENSTDLAEGGPARGEGDGPEPGVAPVERRLPPAEEDVGVAAGRAVEHQAASRDLGRPLAHDVLRNCNLLLCLFVAHPIVIKAQKECRVVRVVVDSLLLATS